MENRTKNQNIFLVAAVLTIIFAALEIIYGFISSSLMIIGDGIHMASDSISLILSLVAAFLAQRAATSNRTFGYKRFEPIAAFINGLTLILLPIYIIYEALNRLISPVDIQSVQMIIVGTLGLVINGVVGYILSKGEKNLNMRSAILHVFADMLTSLSAVVVGIFIFFFQLYWLDPIGSIITSIIIISGGLKITREAFNILMEGTPKGYSIQMIEDSIHDICSKAVVDDVKIWCINEEEIYTLIKMRELCGDRFEEIKHQIENKAHIPFNNIYIDIIKS